MNEFLNLAVALSKNYWWLTDDSLAPSLFLSLSSIEIKFHQKDDERGRQKLWTLNITRKTEKDKVQTARVKSQTIRHNTQ